MFAYCNNNCVFCNDYSGRYATFDPDLLVDEEEAVYCNLINGQGLEPYASMGFGSSNLENSGCTVIAFHDGLILSDHPSDIRHWISYFQSKRFFRLFGVFPWEIDDALDEAGVAYEGSFEPGIIENCKNGGVVIVTFWNRMTTIPSAVLYSGGLAMSYDVVPVVTEGAHTVAVTYRNGQYLVYNAYRKWPSPYPFSNIDSYIGGGFIYGYYIAP